MSYKIEIELLMPDRKACEDLLEHLREVKRQDFDGESEEVKCELEELSTLIPINNPHGVVTSYSVTLIPEEENEDERVRFDLRTTLKLTIPSIEELRKENDKIQAALDKFGTYEVAKDEPCSFEFSATSEVVFPREGIDNIDELIDEMQKTQNDQCICEKCHKPNTENFQCNVS